MPTIEATIITTSTTDRLATNGEGELPTGVPARNQGAVAAIDPHQAAAAAVMIGMDNATATANIPRILSLANSMFRWRVATTAAAVQARTVTENSVPTTTNMSWYHPNPALRW
jgi:hypothetical protein